MNKKITVLALSLFIVPTVASDTQPNKSAAELDTVQADVVQAIQYWKHEVQDTPELVTLLEELEVKLADVSQVERTLYGFLLNRVHSTKDLTKQTQLLKNLLSKSSKEIMKECAVLIKLTRSSHQADSEQE